MSMTEDLIKYKETKGAIRVGDQELNTGLPTGKPEVVKPEIPVAEKAPEVSIMDAIDADLKAVNDKIEKVPDAGAEKPLIKIGKKEFANKEDAIKYAQEIERESAVKQAYEDGVREAIGKELDTLTDADKKDNKNLIDEIQDMIFENPKEALKKLETHIQSNVTKLIEDKDTARAKVETEKNIWNDFWQKNPELQAKEDFVKKYVLTKNWAELSNMNAAEGMAKLAEYAKTEVKQLVEMSKPKTVLSAGAAQVEGVSGNPIAYTQKEAPKRVDFVTQLRNSKKRGA